MTETCAVDDSLLQAAAAADRGDASFRWLFLTRLAQCATWLDERTRLAVECAVDALESQLGPGWLADSKGRCPLPSLGAWPIGDSERPIRRLTILGRQFERFATSPGFDIALGRCRWKEDQWRHLALQLEVASLASHLGHPISFEDSTGGGRFADVAIALPSGQVLVETTVSGLDGRTRRASEMQDLLSARLREPLGRLQRGCTIEVLDEIDADHIEDVAAQVAQLQPDFVPARMEVGGVRLTFDANETRWEGLTVTGDEWARMAARLRTKVEQAGAAETWVRYDHDGFLFVLNSFAGGSLARRLTALQQNARSILGLGGLVLSTSGPTGHSKDGVVRRHGAASIRRTHRYGTREVHIIALSENLLPDIDLWIDMYTQEERAVTDLLAGTCLIETL